MSSLRLHEVILYVQNMNRQVTFYEAVLGLRRTYPDELDSQDGAHWVTFDTGQCTLALHSGGQGNHGNDAPRFVFAVDDLPKWHLRLSSEVPFVSEIRTPAPGVSVFDSSDPEGNRFSLESVSDPH